MEASGAALRARPAIPDPCFVNPLIVQNNQYSSQSYALYEGGIAELKKRFSYHFTRVRELHLE